MSKIKEEYKKEKGFDVWVEHPNYGSYTDDYVNWLEEQLRLCGVGRTCCDKTRSKNIGLERPTKYCTNCGNDL